MPSFISRAYDFVLTIPDRLYPFACEIEGQWVRGKRSYEQALAHALKEYGPGRFGLRLLIYREAFHFVGSIIFIVSATVVSKTFFGNDIALYVLLGAAILALSFQEFYLHPKRFGQRTQKGIADLFAWILPMGIFLLLFL